MVKGHYCNQERRGLHGRQEAGRLAPSQPLEMMALACLCSSPAGVGAVPQSQAAPSRPGLGRRMQQRAGMAPWSAIGGSTRRTRGDGR